MVGVGVAPAGALERFPGPWHRDSATEPSQTAHGGGHDDRACAAPASPAPTTTVPAPTGAATVSQTVSVVVPPIVRVQSDDSGALVVVTNAARPPAPGDQVYRRQPDGNYAPADAALVTRVMSAHWADGSWCSTTAVHRSVTSDGNHGHDGHDDRAGEDR